MELKVAFYKDWMQDQIVELTCNHYGYGKNEYQKKFSNFYESSFQENAIKVVVLKNDIVIGFMGFFYWPYQYNGKTYNTFQAGNVIVHPDFRGQRIFHRMVDFMNQNYQEKKVDLLIGFPVIEAFKTYIRNQWENILNLQWYLKINNPFSFLFPLNKDKIKQQFSENKKEYTTPLPNIIYMDNSRQCISWKEGYYNIPKYYYTFKNEQAEIQFGIRLNIRKKIINELIIGEISTNNYTVETLTSALKEVLRKIRKIGSITIVSIAINANDKIIVAALTNLRFRKIDKQIFYVVKNFTNELELMNKDKWVLFRGDLDTW